MPRVLRVGRYEVQEAGRQLLADGRPVPLGARAFDLLVALADSPEHFLGKDDLMARVWPGVVVEDNNITVQVSALRKALGADAIVTVPQRGYRLALPVAVGGAATSAAQPALALPDKPSVAVLPLANLSGQPGDEYFCDGITEDITTELARFHSLFVIARNSAFTYKGRAVDVRTVAAELGVRYVVEGSVRRAGERVRVTAQLVDASTGQHLWAEKYDRVLHDIFDLQEEVTRAIVGAIAPQIEAGETLRIAAKPASLTAYDLALRAWALVQSTAGTAPGAAAQQAVQLAKEALAVDPGSALAVRTITYVRVVELYYGSVAANAPDADEALRLAVSAVAADPSSHGARLWKGLVLGILRRSEEALIDLRAARELNPNDAETAGWLGFYEGLCGNPAKGVQLANEALRLSPRDPQRYLFCNQLAWSQFAAADYAASVAAARAALGERPDFAASQLCLCVALAALGDKAAAHAGFLRARELAPQLVQTRLEGGGLGDWPDYRERLARFLRAAAEAG